MLFVMLSYRHGFHAGSPADVLKHSLLIFCLDYLVQKEKPLLCIDTHAGAGSYPLDGGFAAQKREWEQGAEKLFSLVNINDAGVILRRYLQLCRGEGGEGDYPGSPLIMARLLRPSDRLVCFELHPADYAACKSLLQSGPGRRVEVRQADGFAGLKSLLPPPSRRGLILIDPPYEVKEDYSLLPEALASALRRFPAGVYLVWYPLLREPPLAGGGGGGLAEKLMGLYQGNRCRIELYTAAPGESPANSPRGMYGSGMVIYNPPWTLRAAALESLPVLGSVIGIGKDGWAAEFQGGEI